MVTELGPIHVRAGRRRDLLKADAITRKRARKEVIKAAAFSLELSEDLAKGNVVSFFRLEDLGVLVKVSDDSFPSLVAAIGDDDALRQLRSLPAPTSCTSSKESALIIVLRLSLGCYRCRDRFCSALLLGSEE